MESKECRKCLVTKPTSEFYGNTQHKDGLASYCKACFNAMVKAKYVTKPPRERPPEGFKKCGHCKEIKPVADFGSNRKNPDGLQGSCKPCATAAVRASQRKDPTSHRLEAKKWRAKNRQRHYDNSVRHRIGKHVLHGTYERLFAEQNGRCAICGIDGAPVGGDKWYRLQLDHCHTTDAVRGLLCGNCNSMLGYARDNTAIINAAIQYLKLHGVKDEGGV